MIQQIQHRFVPCRSWHTNLISFFNRVMNLLDQRNVVDVVFLDFNKVFDRLSHDVLMWKPEDCEWTQGQLGGYTLLVVVWNSTNLLEKKYKRKFKNYRTIIEQLITISTEAVLLDLWDSQNYISASTELKSISFSIAKITLAAKWIDKNYHLFTHEETGFGSISY